MIREIQLLGIVINGLMALALALWLPLKTIADPVANRSRWLMAAGLFILSVHFTIQYLTDFRSNGTTYAVVLNLSLFVPASTLLSLSILNLQRQGRLRRHEWGVGIATWGLALAIITLGTLTSDGANGTHMPQLGKAVVASAILYAAMQLYYAILILRGLNRIRRSLNNYYDYEHVGLLGWMRWNVIVMEGIALGVPAAIFASEAFLVTLALLAFACLFYLWFSFVHYLIADVILHIRTAEEETAHEHEQETGKESDNTRLSHDETNERVTHAIQQWTAADSHLRAGLTSPAAAAEMQIPRYLLTAWVRDNGYASFTQWITTLRIDAAKQLLAAHHDWSVEAVADSCGFSRTHFQRIFKRETGMSPMEYQKKAR